MKRIPYLDNLRSRGTFVDFYDPEAEKHPLPTYPYRWAPEGLLTMRQLRARGLRPGGQEIAAQILWRHRGRQRRVAYLYKEQQAKPKRDATPAQRQAIAKALLARRTCPSCGKEQEYFIPRSQGECNPCADGWNPPWDEAGPTRDEAETEDEWELESA